MSNRRNKRLSRIPLVKDASGLLVRDYRPRTRVGRRRLVKLLEVEINAEVVKLLEGEINA